MSETPYRIVSYGVLLLVVSYIGLGQFLISNGWTTGSTLQSFFTGPARLQVQDYVLQLKLTIEFNSLELRLLEPIKDCSELLLQGAAIPKQTKVECSDDRYWLTIDAPRDQSLRGALLQIKLRGAEEPQVGIKRYVTIVRIDKRPQNIPEVYQHLIDRNNSNVKLYYPFYVFNVSSYFAELFGIRFLHLITTFLLVLLACQLLLFCLSYWQPETVAQYFDNPDRTPVSQVDAVSNRFAIPLGFLGTVSAIWVSLENVETNYASFFQVLDIMRIAIFTTVLGLFIKLLCLLRGYLARPRN